MFEHLFEHGTTLDRPPDTRQPLRAYLPDRVATRRSARHDGQVASKVRPGRAPSSDASTHGASTELASVLDSMLDPFILLTAVRDDSGALVDLRYLEANDAAVAYNQLTREEMIGARLLDLFPGQLDHGPLRQYFHTIETGEPTVLDDYAYPHEIIGQERRYDIRATRAGDGVALTWRDVTDRHREAQRVAESERLYRLLAENSSEVVLYAEDGRTISWVSEAAAATLGYLPAQLTGHTAAEFVHPDDLSRMLEGIRVSDDTGTINRLRLRWRLPDGTYCWVEAAGRPVEGSHGRVVVAHRVDNEVRTEADLATSEALFRRIALNMKDVILLADQTTAFDWVSPSVTTTLGWAAEDIIGRRATDFVHPDDVPRLRDDVQHSNEAMVAIYPRYRWRTPDGGYRWIQASGRPFVDETTGELRRLVTLRDIDDQVRAEQELEASERLYRLLAENSSDVILLADGTGLLHWVSPSVAEMLGWAEAEIVGRHVREFVHPDDRTRLAEAIARSSETTENVTLRYRWRHRDGHYVWVEGAGHPVRDESGQQRRVVRLRDIDHEVAAEEELATSEEQYRLIAENSSDVIILADEENRALWVSPSVATALGWEPQDMVGHAAHEFMHPDDWPADDHLGEDRSARLDRPQRYRVRTKDGSFRSMEAVVRSLSDGSGAGGRRVVRLRDIEEQVRAEDELAASERLYRLLTENSSDIVLLADQEGTVLWASPVVENELGWTPAEMVGRRNAEFIHPDDVAPMLTTLRASVASGTVARLKYRLRSKDGCYHWFDASGRNLPADEKAGVRRVVRLRNIDDQVAAEAGLAASESTYRVLAENASDVVWQVDDEGDILWISPSVTSVLGWQPDDLVGRPSSELIDAADRDRFGQAVDHVRRGRAMSGEYRAQTVDGSTRWMEVSLRTARAEDHAARIGTLRDIDDVVQARRSMEFALQHDQATGLPVRQAVMEGVRHLQHQMHNGDQVAVLTIGIDHLKDINDAFGHHVGDAVVSTLAGRIGLAIGTGDALGRGTGDEFIAVHEDVSDPVIVAQLAERIRTQCHGEVEILGHRIDPTVSVGIALGTRRADAEALLRDSTLAMHHAKAQGRDRWVFADPDLANEAAQRMAIESALRTGLDRNEFVAWYQPVVALRNGNVVGYESLVRWIRDGTVEMPDDFLPVAERSGLVAAIDQSMAEQVVERLSRLPEEMFIAVNVSAFTLETTPFASFIQGLLQRHGVDARRLHMEVTETRLFTVAPAILEQMRLLDGIGVRWYVDDFGTGYSSITHVRDLPVAGLKLDKSFTEGIREGDVKARNLADALLGLANGLGLDTVAEGIETQAEAAYLRTLGWQHAQGWLYGKAAPLP